MNDSNLLNELEQTIVSLVTALRAEKDKNKNNDNDQNTFVQKTVFKSFFNITFF